MKQTQLIALAAFLFLQPCATLASTPGNIVRYSLLSEPPQLDTTRALDGISQFVLAHVMEGLVRLGPSNELAPGVAEKWKQDGTRVVFHLRKTARWSDGKPVTARDFVYAWRASVDPKNGSDYSFAFYSIRNAQEITQGRKPVSELGVRAADDWTLEVALIDPIPYFAASMALSVFYPVREDFRTAQGTRYGAGADNLLYNGPFRITEWVHGASLRMGRNPVYWNAKAVQLDGIEVPHISGDSSAHFNFFNGGQTDFLDLSVKESVGKAQKAGLKLHPYPRGVMVFLEFNQRENRLTQNRNLRKAIAAAIDAEELVDHVIAVPGNQAAHRIVPSWMRGVRDKYVKEHPLAAAKPDARVAREALRLALSELKLEKLPPLVLLAPDSARSRAQSQYLQNALQKTLGIEVRIDSQVFKQVIVKQHAGEFDLNLSSWGADFPDPFTFLERFAGWSQYDDGGYRNADYDRRLRQLQKIADPGKRFKAIAEAERMLLEDPVFVPLIEDGFVFVQNEKLRGVARHPLSGDPDFTRASFRAR